MIAPRAFTAAVFTTTRPAAMPPIVAIGGDATTLASYIRFAFTIAEYIHDKTVPVCTRIRGTVEDGFGRFKGAEAD